MKVIIIDDEKAFHLVMNRLLTEMEGVEVVGCFQHPEEAMKQMSHTKVDLAFIDIEIGRQSGLDVARELRSLYTDLNMVFVTSHK